MMVSPLGVGTEFLLMLVILNEFAFYVLESKGAQQSTEEIGFYESWKI